MLTGKSVLIVEDEALIAVDLETVLLELGAIHVSTRGGGEDNAPGSDRYDLAVVDIRTALAHARDLVLEIDAGRVPVVFLTTDPDGEDLPPFSGSFQVVQKPFTYEDLCAAIARLIG